MTGLRDIRRRLQRLQRALAPRLPPPPATAGPPAVVLYMPVNNTGPESATEGDPGPYRSRLGAVELVIFDPAQPPPASSHDGGAAITGGGGG